MRRGTRAIGPRIRSLIPVPDIGHLTDVPIIEVFAKPCDVVNADDPLITLESDKASMDLPTPRTSV